MVRNAPKLVENILSLLSAHEKTLPSLFGLPVLECKKCGFRLKKKDQLTYDLETEHLQSSMLIFDVEMLFYILMQGYVQNECCLKNSINDQIQEKFLVLTLSHSLDV